MSMSESDGGGGSPEGAGGPRSMQNPRQRDWTPREAPLVAKYQVVEMRREKSVLLRGLMQMACCQQQVVTTLRV